MQYKLNNDFTALNVASGVFYVMPGYSVELAIASGNAVPEKDNGFVLNGGRPVHFSTVSGTIYVRATGTHATLNVVEGTLTT